MKKFIIEDSFWNLFPNAKIGIVICNNIDNSIRDKEQYAEIILEAEKEVLKYLQDAEFSKNQVIKVWREALQKFKTKKGARSSIEALLKRVSNGNHIGTINPLVDIYNSISLRYALPCGGEDIDKFVGDVRLTTAVGNEEFIPLGTDENSPPYEGEIVYKDDKGAICRCWNWREAVRTMLTEDTNNAFLCIELTDESRVIEFQNALKDLSKKVQDNLGGASKISILDINNKELVIEWFEEDKEMNSFSYKDIYIEDGKRVLEVNILPEKSCNFDCIFCPIGRSQDKVDIQKSFDEMDSSLRELESRIENTKAELIFINSKGEAFVNDRIVDIIDLIKEKGIPVRLLSNGYLLGRDEYIEIANRCDEIIGEIKTITEEDFQKAQRPIDGYTLEEYISNMVSFNKQYKGNFIFEITIIKGYNDDEKSIQKLKNIIKEISPYKIIVSRMDDERFKKKLGITDERFEEISKILLNS